MFTLLQVQLAILDLSGHEDGLTPAKPAPSPLLRLSGNDGTSHALLAACAGTHLTLLLPWSTDCAGPTEVRVTQDALAWEEDEGLEGRYANCFRVGYNRFETVIDCGQVSENERVRLHSRILTNPRSAKALHSALQQSLEEYESTFGKIEELTEE